jgi:hypothetical protein
MLEHPERATQWNNHFLISLSIENEQKLQKLLQNLIDHGIHVSYFTEPDLGDQLTSIAFEGSESASKLTSSLPLSLKEINQLQK